MKNREIEVWGKSVVSCVTLEKFWRENGKSVSGENPTYNLFFASFQYFISRSVARPPHNGLWLLSVGGDSWRRSSVVSTSRAGGDSAVIRAGSEHLILTSWSAR